MLSAEDVPSAINQNGTIQRWDEYLGEGSHLQLSFPTGKIPHFAREVLHYGHHHLPQVIGDDFEEVDYINLSSSQSAEQAKAQSQRWIEQAYAFLASISHGRIDH